jgi:hypothetical protein
VSRATWGQIMPERSGGEPNKSADQKFALSAAETAVKLACSGRTQIKRLTPKRNVSDAHFFSSISAPSLRIAPVNLCAILASSQGNITSSRT